MSYNRVMTTKKRLTEHALTWTPPIQNSAHAPALQKSLLAFDTVKVKGKVGVACSTTGA